MSTSQAYASANDKPLCIKNSIKEEISLVAEYYTKITLYSQDSGVEGHTGWDLGELLGGAVDDMVVASAGSGTGGEGQ